MSTSTYVAAQLRESAGYLKDAGWYQTADLMVAAAEEIETLRGRLADGPADASVADGP